MKKVFIISIMFFLLVLNGCEKNASSDTANILRNELKSFANEVIEPITISSPCNFNNSFDSWGEAMFIGISKVMSDITKADYNSNDFVKMISGTIPQEFLKIDTTGVNLPKVSLVFKEFLSIFIKRNIFEALQISFKMESCVSQTRFLADKDKAYLLKMVSILRFTSYLSFSKKSKSADGSYERCWKRKLQEMEDSGFFEQLACVSSWPLCFAAMLADCGLEEFKDHVIN